MRICLTSQDLPQLAVTRIHPRTVPQSKLLSLNASSSAQGDEEENDGDDEEDDDDEDEEEEAPTYVTSRASLQTAGGLSHCSMLE